MKLHFQLFALIGFLSIQNMFAQTWVTFTKTSPAGPVLTLVTNTNQQVKFTAEIPGMFTRAVSEQGTVYQRLAVPDYPVMKIEGSPELPYVKVLLAVPECSNIGLNVTVNSSLTLNNYIIYPAPAHQEITNPDGSKYLAEVFAKTLAVYNTNQFMPSMVAEIKSTGYIRGQKVAEVWIYPMQYNPVTKHISVNSKLQLTLSFTNPTSPVCANTGIFSNVCESSLLNYTLGGLGASINTRVANPGTVNWVSVTDTLGLITADYLIITDNNFYNPHSPSLDSLALHRANFNGFDVAIVNVNSVLNSYYPDDNDPLNPYIKEQKIRNFIKKVYESGTANHTYDGHLGFICLVGDVGPFNTGMPTSYYKNGFTTSYSVANDYFFSCIKGRYNSNYDYFGDVFIGRICAGDAFELTNAVFKIIRYEKEANFYNWKKNVLLTSMPYDYDVYVPGIENLINTIADQIIDTSQYIVNQVTPALTTQLSIAQDQMRSFINTGQLFVSYYGHGNTISMIPFNISDFNKLNNGDRQPFFASIACYNGQFDIAQTFPGQNTDCFAERFTNEREKGSIGFIGASRAGDWDEEFFKGLHSAIWSDMMFVTSELTLDAKFKYGDPSINAVFNLFGDPAINLMSEGFIVSESKTLSNFTTGWYEYVDSCPHCNVIIDTIYHPFDTVFISVSTDVTVLSGVTLTISKNSVVHFSPTGKLIIDEGATLIIEDNVEIIGQNQGNSIEIYGNISIGNHVSFISCNNQTWSGIKLLNHKMPVILNNSLFKNCYLSGFSSTLDSRNCSFVNSGIDYSMGNVNLNGSTFVNSNVVFTNAGSKTGYVNIEYCTFDRSPKTAINIDGYPLFLIENNEVKNSDGDGICLINSGITGNNSNQVFSNRIENNTLLDDLCFGIKVYNSKVNIVSNIITGNSNGIACFRGSFINLEGNKDAVFVNETQNIVQNSIYQLFVTDNSFPYNFRFNAVYGNDLHQYPLVLYKDNNLKHFEVSYNYWGEDFDPELDFFPSGLYLYEPVWFLENTIPQQPQPETLFKMAYENIETGNYYQGETTLKQIVSNYPESVYALAALKVLFSIRELTDGDYDGLKTYLNNETAIGSADGLNKLAGYISNNCDIKLKHYPEAVSWFEDKILNPVSFEDSIFAIIDLGYLYLLMEQTDQKIEYIGKLPEFKPKSKEQFFLKRDDLLKLLFEKINNNQNIWPLTDDKNGTPFLINIFPNPSKSNTNILFKTGTPSLVQLKIFNAFGQEVGHFINKIIPEGSHQIEITTTEWHEGIYYYRLIVNNKIIGTRKMLIIK